MYFLRRPGQAIFLGPYRLSLTSSSRLCARWQIDLPATAPLHKATGLLTYGRNAHRSVFSLVPGEWIQIADIARMSLSWSSANQVHILLSAPPEVRLLRAELLEPSDG